MLTAMEFTASGVCSLPYNIVSSVRMRTVHTKIENEFPIFKSHYIFVIVLSHVISQFEGLNWRFRRLQQEIIATAYKPQHLF